MLVINSIEKTRLSADSYSYSGTGVAWKARLVLFLGFALMAGGLAGSVVSRRFLLWALENQEGTKNRRIRMDRGLSVDLRDLCELHRKHGHGKLWKHGITTNSVIYNANKLIGSSGTQVYRPQIPVPHALFWCRKRHHKRPYYAKVSITLLFLCLSPRY